MHGEDTYGGQWSTTTVFLHCSPTISFGIGFLVEAETCCPVGLSDSLVSSSPELRLQAHTTVYGFFMNAGEPTWVHMPIQLALH